MGFYKHKIFILQEFFVKKIIFCLLKSLVWLRTWAVYNERLHLARDLLETMGEESNNSVARVVEILPQLENKATEDDLLAEKINRFKELNEDFIDYDNNTAYAKYRRIAVSSS